ncbi:U11/U12 small nuclear ribonucleoprotein 35 kDa protein isoform X2 [Lactuca sativa]|uniref:RRM domain-containing protein n=1 Tax=Lactuca sativa TaxID=4236 RepID=A0A9R1WLM3_LACSA|nr:U11/U12 small nuclear ribonucleoprotein 35 kDa protein isoform X2 [Lactuca sativa]KAJ0225948.1 hypothetical protein LSAT_V11C100027850 [Lactuca sativa]
MNTMNRNKNNTNSSKLNSVFYAQTYHPIQAGSIDGTDILPHDNAVYRALLCSSAGLYDPFGDPNVIGEDPYCTVFVGHLSQFTTEDTLRKAMSKYGTVKNLRLVRHIVTGASQGYAFVEFKSEREMQRAYEKAHHSVIDDSEIIVDYNRQQLMPGWIPRRLGGGLGGKKESGQLRFGGRERPFRAPLRPIPLDDLKRLGIPPPPEGHYMSRFEVPSPPLKKRTSVDRDREERHRKSSSRHERRRSSSRDHIYEETKDGYGSKKRSNYNHEHEKRSSSRNYEYDDERDSHKHHRSSTSTSIGYDNDDDHHRSDTRRSRSGDREHRSHKRHRHE